MNVELYVDRNDIPIVLNCENLRRSKRLDQINQVSKFSEGLVLWSVYEADQLGIIVLLLLIIYMIVKYGIMECI